MDLLEKFPSFIKKEGLFRPKDRLLLAVSGGVDSVVLCDLCHRAGYAFAIAHCNFQLRGTDSDNDEIFVKELEKKYGVEVVVQRFDTREISLSQKKSIEETARDLRYQWFGELLKNGIPGQNESPFLPDRVLTAHHADDNIETLLMNFFRGTGIRGMHGILPKQGNLIRPLLFAKKEELLVYAQEQKLQHVTDHTNAENIYTRNFFRNKVIPLVAEQFPGVQDSLLKNIRRMGEAELLYNQAVEMQTKKLLENKGDEVHIPVLKLKKTVPLSTMVYEVIKDFGFTAHQVDEVCELLDSETGKYISSASHRIIKNRKWLIISPLKTEDPRMILIESEQGVTGFPGGGMEWKKMEAPPSGMKFENNTEYLDASKIVFPLLLRKWKSGDYFYPLGMKKKKKISRFLSDLKLSLIQKEKVWVLESAKKIIWVAGLRIDDRFKIMPSTKTVMSITIKGQDLAG